MASSAALVLLTPLKRVEPIGVTPAMLAEARGRPDDASIRRALVRWGFNTKQRSDPPDDAAQVLDWVARNTAPVSRLTEPATARQMLDLATSTVDGRNAAASTARRYRIILANAMDYAVERGLLETNPLLQIAATTHSPYLLDCMETDEVRMTFLKEDGATACASLADHPNFPKWKDEMTPGEMWSLFGEKWLVEREAVAP